MLKLEKSKSSQIILLLQRKAPSPTLYLALSIALCLHLLFFFLFTVTFPSYDSPGLLPPVYIEADVSQLNTTNAPLSTPYGLFPIEKMQTSAPVRPQPHHDTLEILPGKVWAIDVPSFHQLERTLLEDEEPLAAPTTFKAHLHLSKDLPPIKPLKELETLLTPPLPDSTTYTVLLETGKGRLFEFKKLGAPSSFDSFYEDFLIRLRFEKEKNSRIVLGIIDLQFYEGDLSITYDHD